MDWKLIVDVAAIASVLVAFIGLLFTARAFRKQMDVQLFLTFTDRYIKAIDTFSPEARAARLAVDGEPPPHTPQLCKQVLRYMNLCSEEYHLYRNGYLAEVLWQMWEPKMRKTLQSPMFQREWQHLADEFHDHPQFQEYVRAVIAEVKKTVVTPGA